MAEAKTAKQVGVSFFSTGSVRLTTAGASQPMSSQSVFLRRLRAFTDLTWSKELPIGVFLIAHPDGPVLFDTGESSRWNDPGYVSNFSPVKFVTRISINPEDGIVAQLERVGVSPKDLQAIVISHLHSDHAGGLEDLAKVAPNVPVYLSEEHWSVAGISPWKASMMGYTPQHYPENFVPRLLEFRSNAVGPWKESCKITPDGCILVVKTPGHVPGHVSMIVYGHDGNGGGVLQYTSCPATRLMEFISSIKKNQMG